MEAITASEPKRGKSEGLTTARARCAGACRAYEPHPLDAFHQIERLAIGPVADGMDHDLEAGFHHVGHAPAIEAVLRATDAMLARPVAVVVRKNAPRDPIAPS